MYLPGSANQTTPYATFYADGTIASGSLPQLILPAGRSRSSLLIQNNHASAVMWIGKGPARAHCAITSGAVSSVTTDNAGFNYTKPPRVVVEGGGGNYVTPTSWPLGKGQENWEVPTGPTGRPARIRAVLTSGAISSWVIDDPGAGYVNVPEIVLINDPADPFGCFDPSLNSGRGIQLTGGGSAYTTNGTVCDTQQIAIFCSTISAPFVVEYAL